MKKGIGLKNISAQMSAKVSAKMSAMAMGAPIERPTIVLFDMDGTTVRHVNPRFLSVLEFLDDFLYKTTCFFSRNKPIKDYSDEPRTKKRLLVHRALHKFRRKPVEQIVQPCPGIFRLLNLFKDNDVPMGIVSNSLGKGYGHDILETFNLGEYFSAQIFREDIEKSKPHPDPILRALRAIKEAPDGQDIVWYIGDRHKDVRAALAANKLSPCRIMPFSYGLNAAVGIIQNNVGNNHIIVNYLDFFTRINPLFKK